MCLIEIFNKIVIDANYLLVDIYSRLDTVNWNTVKSKFHLIPIF